MAFVNNAIKVALISGTAAVGAGLATYGTDGIAARSETFAKFYAPKAEEFSGGLIRTGMGVGLSALLTAPLWFFNATKKLAPRALMAMSVGAMIGGFARNLVKAGAWIRKTLAGEKANKAAAGGLNADRAARLYAEIEASKRADVPALGGFGDAGSRVMPNSVRVGGFGDAGSRVMPNSVRVGGFGNAGSDMRQPVRTVPVGGLRGFPETTSPRMVSSAANWRR